MGEGSDDLACREGSLEGSTVTALTFEDEPASAWRVLAAARPGRRGEEMSCRLDLMAVSEVLPALVLNGVLSVSIE